MAESSIESHGFVVGRWRIPAFSLGCGQSITLRFPLGAFVDQEIVAAALTGTQSVPGLTLHGPIVVAGYARNPTGWRQRFFPSTTFDWMKAHTKLSDNEIATYLREHDADPQVPLNRYGGHQRMFLGLAAAYAKMPKAIILCTAGLDPLGVREAFRIVSGRLAECSAVYLAGTTICQGQQFQEIFPGSLIVPVADTSNTPFLSSAISESRST
jgi:hypothetical protein